jgi:hypothetical protein
MDQIEKKSLLKVMTPREQLLTLLKEGSLTGFHGIFDLDFE